MSTLNLDLSNAIAFYDATGEQTQCWRYHKSLGDDHPHEILIVESMIQDLEPGLVEKAIELVIRRHESLRTFFRIVEGEIKQCVIPYKKELFTPSYYDLSTTNDGEKTTPKINHIIDETKKSLRDLTVPPLLKTSIFKLPDDRYYICIVIHHIITDEWSDSIMYGEISRIYQILKEGRPVDIKPLQLQLRDYALWQKKWLEENYEQMRRYWGNKLQFLKDSPGPAELYHQYRRFSNFPVDNMDSKRTINEEELRAILDCGKSSSYSCNVDLPKYKRLLKFSKDCKVSFWSIIGASLQLLFYFTDQKQALVAMPVSSRFLPGSKSLIGYMIGTVYLYHAVREETRILEFIKEVYVDFVESADNLIYDHDKMKLDGEMLRFHTKVVLNFIGKEIARNKEISFESSNTHQPLDRPEYYALSFCGFQFEDGLLAMWRYNRILYTPERIEFMGKKQFLILDIIIQKPQITIKELMAVLNN